MRLVEETARTMGYFVAVWIALIIIASPFIALSLVPTFLFVRSVRRTIQLTAAASFLTLAMFWILTFAFLAVSDLIEGERLTAEGDPPWWVWLAFYDFVFSGPVLAIGAVVGWKAAKPRDPVERSSQ
jgi:hypothetical protein